MVQLGHWKVNLHAIPSSLGLWVGKMEHLEIGLILKGTGGDSSLLPLLARCCDETEVSFTWSEFTFGDQAGTT